MGSTSRNICLVFLPSWIVLSYHQSQHADFEEYVLQKPFSNVVIVGNTHSKHVLFRYFVHFAKLFPAHVKGGGEECVQEAVVSCRFCGSLGIAVWQYFSSSGKYIKSSFQQATCLESCFTQIFKLPRCSLVQPTNETTF